MGGNSSTESTPVSSSSSSSSSSSTPAGDGGGLPKQTAEQKKIQDELIKKSFNWGLPPESPPDSERDPDELVLQSWVSCRAKPSPAKSFRSDVEERDRRAALAWRKRSSFIELDCGEDSFFVSNTYKTIGVADGVGGWRDEGYDSTVFANEIMRLAKLYTETHRGERDPEKIMQAAHDRLKAENLVAAGSSTALIASIRNIEGAKNQKALLDIANLGDSGLMVIREEQIIHRAHEKAHGINAPFQLACVPERYMGKTYNDRVSDSVREQFEVKEGDVIVMGSDGLFDNRFCSQIAADALYIGSSKKSIFENVPIVGGLLKTFLGGAERTGYADPYRVAQKIVGLAYASSVSTSVETPWSRGLKQHGLEGAEGGKVDDITLVLARVVSRETSQKSTMW